MWRPVEIAGVLWLVCAAGCGEPPPDPAVDATHLRTLMNGDPTDEPMQRAVDLASRRPVFAAEIVEQEVLPAARRQLEEAEAITVAAEPVAATHQRLVAAYRARITAVEGYQRALAGGTQTPDAEMFEAMSALTDVDMSLLRIHDELDAFAPLPE